MIDFSIVVPVYRNAENIPSLLECLTNIQADTSFSTEVVFVVDGSPDQSGTLLSSGLSKSTLRARIIYLSRNFGSFNAILAGLEVSRGRATGVIAADLQEPPELLIAFATELHAGNCDVCVGRRSSRQDDRSTTLVSNCFWWLYRSFIQPEMPSGGCDVFGCSRKVRDVLLSLEEANSSLISQLIWLGFRRKEIPYTRRRRKVGKSGWTLKRKWQYMRNAVYSFTDLPIRMLTSIGAIGTATVVIAAIVVLSASLTGSIKVPGYAPIMLAVLFIGSLNLLALGVVGNYVWRTYENSKGRPRYIIADSTQFPPDEDPR